MNTKIIRLSAALIAFATLPETLSASPMASTMFGMENLVRKTPFDNRLQAAGFFKPLQTIASLQSNTDLNGLFMEARSFRYVNDAPGDRWQSPDETDRRRSGDCEDKALWLYARLKQAGYTEVRLVIGRRYASDNGLHAWVAVKDGEDILILDPVAQKRIWTLRNFSPEESYVPIFSFNENNRYGHATIPTPSL